MGGYFPFLLHPNSAKLLPFCICIWKLKWLEVLFKRLGQFQSRRQGGSELSISPEQDLLVEVLYRTLRLQILLHPNSPNRISSWKCFCALCDHRFCFIRSCINYASKSRYASKMADYCLQYNIYPSVFRSCFLTCSPRMVFHAFWSSHSWAVAEWCWLLGFATDERGMYWSTYLSK